MNRIVRVLIVDDSAYVRKVLRQMLTRSPFIEVVGA
ncbi:MAG TPA: chemotaxis response regulator protein-glutamate methylesterase, partial [Gammaproteobacteria bacterium]|nr:chemotaxis response regulator protein-glutamate methylesterase [Gammaproteobacteria bacterium]